MTSQAYVLSCQWELRGQVLKTCWVQPQCALPQNAVGSPIQKKPRLHDRADDGDAVFKIPIALRIAAGEGNSIAQHGHVEGPLRWLSKTVQTGAAQIAELLRAGHRYVRDRRNRTDVESANVALSAHIKPAVRRWLSAAVSRRESPRRMEAQNISPLIDRMVVLPIKNIGNALDVAAQRASRKRQRIVIAFPACRIDRIVHRVIRNRRRDRAGDDSVQRARARDAAELQLREQ